MKTRYLNTFCYFANLFRDSYVTKLSFPGGDAAQAASDAAAAAAAAHTGSTTNVHPLLSSFINYTHPIKFQGTMCRAKLRMLGARAQLRLGSHK